MGVDGICGWRAVRVLMGSEGGEFEGMEECLRKNGKMVVVGDVVDLG